MSKPNRSGKFKVGMPLHVAIALGKKPSSFPKQKGLSSSIKKSK